MDIGQAAYQLASVSALRLTECIPVATIYYYDADVDGQNMPVPHSTVNIYTAHSLQWHSCP